MSGNSNILITLEPIDALLNMLKACNSVLMVALMVLFSQLVGVEHARASEALQPDNNLVVQAETSDQEMTPASSADSLTKESANTYFTKQVHCLALNIYFEARSEPELGQRAVGHVVMNRVAHPKYPDSVCKVVQQGGEQVLHRCQFSWWCDGQSDKPMNQKAWDKSLQLARKIYLGILKDTTGGALWYHANYVKPYWSDILLKGDKIGQHVFYIEN